MSQNIPRALPQQHWPYGPAPSVSAPRKSERGRSGLAEFQTSQKSRDTSHARHGFYKSQVPRKSLISHTHESEVTSLKSRKSKSRDRCHTRECDITPRSHSRLVTHEVTSLESHKSKVTSHMSLKAQVASYTSHV